MMRIIVSAGYLTAKACATICHMIVKEIQFKYEEGSSSAYAGNGLTSSTSHGYTFQNYVNP